MKKRTKVLFVCLGNICRSPLAEAIFKHKLEEHDLQDQFEADSCGTAGYHIGSPPDTRSIANAAKNGVKIEHLGRKLDPSDLEYFDYVLTMDRDNYNHVLNMPRAESYAHKIFLIRDYDPQPGDEVPDPYYGGEQGFQQVFDILDRSISHFLDTMLKK